MKTYRSTMRSSTLGLFLTSALGLLASGGLNAQNAYWTSAGGDWLTDNWYDAAISGNPRGAPSATDQAYISGSVNLSGAASTFVGILGSTAADTGIVNVGNGGVWQNSGTFIVGQSGVGVLNILTGGTVMGNSTSLHLIAGSAAGGFGTINVESGAYLYTGAQIRLGNVASGTGILNIASGATVRAATGLYASLANGTGIVNIATGGTLIIDANTIYVNNGGAANNASYGEVNIDGYFQSGGNGTYYFPVGYAGIGVLNVGATGTVFAGQLDIGREATASGTVTIAGHYETTVVNVSLVGSLGKGTLTIKDGGTFISSGSIFVGNNGVSSGTLVVEGGGFLDAKRYMRVGATGTSTGYLEVQAGGLLNMNAQALTFGGSVASTGTGIISGTVTNVSTLYIAESTPTNNTLIINDGGFLSTTANAWYARNPAATGLNSLYLAGTMDVGGYIVIGNASGHNILDIATTGTLLVGTTGIRVTYTDPLSTAYVNVDGYMGTKTGGGYIIVSHYGESYMRIGTTGTVYADTYISIGQGDGATNPLTASGTVDVLGYMEAKTYVRVANRLTGVLNVATTGTVKAGTNFLISDNNGIASSGTAIIEGTLDIGGNIILGNYAMNTGFLDVKPTSTIIAGGGYTQNALSTLKVELDTSRSPDTVNPDLAMPLLSMGGAAKLSGTLHVHGNAVVTIPEFEYDADGKASARMLTGIPILRASGGIIGDFDVVQIDGLIISSTLPDFIRGGGLKVNEGGPLDTRYDVGYGLAWKSGLADAHGTFTVDANRTFTVDTQLSNRPFIFDSGWDGKSLVKKGPGTLVLAVENAYTGTTTIESGTLRFGGPSQHTIGALVNDSILDFGTSGTTANAAQRTIRANSLAGSGTYHMSINMGQGTSDRLIIAGDAVGTHRLLITNTGTGMPTGDEPTITLISVGGVYDMDHDNEIAIAGGTFYGTFDYGMFNYKIDTQNGKVLIVNTGLLSEIKEPIRGVPGAQSLLWFDHLDNVTRRFGELRMPREGQIGLDIWARGHAASATIGGGSTDTRLSDADIWGAEMGTDYTWKMDDQRATLGIYVGTGNTSQDFKAIPTYDPLNPNPLSLRATGESDLLGIGVYGAWFSDAGWFVNATASVAQYKNSFDYADGSNNHTTADYKDHGYGLTAEIGRRIAIGKTGWFVEPAIQGSIARLTRADYTTEGHSMLPIHGADLTLNRLRGALRAGHLLQTRAGTLELAGRVAVTRERSSGGEMNIGSADRWRPNLDGNRFEAGVSAFWQIGGAGQLYADYEYSAGDNFEKPWAISLGFRLSL